MWTQKEGIELCRKVEQICPTYGYHVALTGGLLYKDGDRKDADLVFYSIRQASPDTAGLFLALKKIGLQDNSPIPAWCVKVTYNGKSVDCFFLEATDEDSRYE